MKLFFSNRLAIPSLGLLVSLLCHNMVIASGDSEYQQKVFPNPTDRYTPESNFNNFIWPTQGVITSGFGKRWGGMHTGIDIAAPIGTPIFAAATGVVVFAGWSEEGYGYLVTLRHPDGSLSMYGHNSRLLVREGQPVEQGQQISEMGSTGHSTGPHLHFEIRPKGTTAVNPIAFLPKQSEFSNSQVRPTRWNDN